MINRQLFTLSLRNSIRALDGLLSYTNLHTLWTDRYYIMGIILAQSQCNAGACGARCDNRVDNDHFDVVNKCSAAKDFVRQVD